MNQNKSSETKSLKYANKEKAGPGLAWKVGVTALSLATGATALNYLHKMGEAKPEAVTSFLAQQNNKAGDPNKIHGYKDVTISATTGDINERSAPAINESDGTPLDNVVSTISKGDKIVATFATKVNGKSGNTNVSQSDKWVAIPSNEGVVYVDVSEAIREGDSVTVENNKSIFGPTNASASIKDNNIYFNGQPIESLPAPLNS